MSFYSSKKHIGFTAALVGSVLLTSFGVQAGAELAYLDDRSTPQSVIESYYNAINQQQYTRAYGYFSQGAAPTNFTSWMKGYETTKHVSLKLGGTEADPGAGQIYWALPVALSVVSTDGQQAVYAGCYHLHMTNGTLQVVPPYAPLSINSASLKKSPLSIQDAVPKSC